jgi:hypothetical protein
MYQYKQAGSTTSRLVHCSRHAVTTINEKNTTHHQLHVRNTRGAGITWLLSIGYASKPGFLYTQSIAWPKRSRHLRKKHILPSTAPGAQGHYLGAWSSHPPDLLLKTFFP